MNSTATKLISVVGATGAQGGGVCAALRAQPEFRVRALSRSAAKAAGIGDEAVAADLTDPATLRPAFTGAYGAFVVTNFWDGPGVDELAQGRAAVDAAKAAGVKHFVWSTLPNVEKLSGGKFDVPHFTKKAEVDALVMAAGFEFATFVEAPFYFQNLTGVIAPQPGADGSRIWNLPMAGTSEVLHVGDISELGAVVAGALLRPDLVGGGQYLAHASERTSFDRLCATLREQGHNVGFNQVPNEVFDAFFPGAKEIREMMNYFEAHTYFGPDAEQKLARAAKVRTSPPTSFADWALKNMPVDA